MTVVSSAEDAQPLRCRNCNGLLGQANFYCPHCGQETRLELPGVMQFIRESSGGLLAMDGRLWRTLFMLVRRPGGLTQEYLSGRRKHFVRPARLFFALSVILFAALRLSTEPVVVDSRAKGDRSLPYLFTVGDSPSAAAARAASAASAAPSAQTVPTPPKKTISSQLDGFLSALDHPLAERLRVRVHHFQDLGAEDKAKQLNNGMLRYGVYALFALLPWQGLLLMAVHWGHRRPHPGRPRRYVEHLVFATHLNCMMLLLMLVSLPLLKGNALLLVLAVLLFIYNVLAQRRVYGGAWWSGILRNGLLTVAYLIGMSTSVFVMVCISMLLE
jgi:hypothetical protein